MAQESRATNHEPRITPAGTARLFFALWPDAGTQRALGAVARELRHECGGRAVSTGNIHLTLVFLGDVERDRMPRLEARAAEVRGTAFELVVDRVEYWRHNRLAWAGVSHCPDALQELVTRLGQALAMEGFPPDERAYVPHITLLRNARRAPMPATPPSITWPVAKFALVESMRHDRRRAYEVVREWPLTA